MGRFARVLVVTMVTVAALLAQKPDGDNNGNGAGDGGEGDGQQQQQSAPRRIRTPNWSGNETETTNLFAVTDFRVVASNQTVSFTVAWNESYLAAMDSRYADIFFSTNLLSPAWMPIGSRYLPWGTNRLDFTIGPWLDDWTYHSAFTNSFGSFGFFTLGLDFDSDGDGLSNVEEYFYGSPPRATDFDGDGLSDLAEIGGIVTSNPLPWLDTSGGTDVTSLFTDPDASCVDWALSSPVIVNGKTYDSLRIDLNGTVYLNERGSTNQQYSANSSFNMMR